MTELGGLLARLVAIIDGAGVPFMIAGSFASTAHGLPRTPQYLDIVIVPPTPEALEALVGAISPSEYYVDVDAARDAMRRRSMFNVIDNASGWKVDFIVRKDRPFSRAELARRMPMMLLGVAVFVASPEDTIVAKLEWSRQAGLRASTTRRRWHRRLRSAATLLPDDDRFRGALAVLDVRVSVRRELDHALLDTQATRAGARDVGDEGAGGGGARAERGDQGDERGEVRGVHWLRVSTTGPARATVGGRPGPRSAVEGGGRRSRWGATLREWNPVSPVSPTSTPTRCTTRDRFSRSSKRS